MGLGWWVVLIVLGLVGRIRGSSCRLTSGLSFCDMVNYNTSIADPVAEDEKVQVEFSKYAPTKRATQDCLDAYRSYLCAMHFPKCPYCTASNGVCAEACIDMMTACGDMAGDTVASCFTGNLFVHNTTADPHPVCTPTPRLSPAQCYQPEPYDVWFCHDVLSGELVASSPTQPAPSWVRMDNISLAQWNSYVRSPGVSAACQSLLQQILCTLNLSPCEDGRVVDPFQHGRLATLCPQVSSVCPTGMSKVCNRAPYAPPSPSGCPTFEQESHDDGYWW